MNEMIININKMILFIFVINILSLFDCIVLKHSSKIVFNTDLKLKTQYEEVIKIKNKESYSTLNSIYFMEYINKINTYNKNKVNKDNKIIDTLINHNVVNFIDIDNENNFVTNNFLDGLKIIDDNIQFENYNDTIIKVKKSKMQRVESDNDYNTNKKNFYILNKNDTINIMNKWSFYNINCYELDNIFRFLFMFFYLNRNVKKIIGVYDYSNFCEYILFFEYRYIENTGYRLFLKHKIKNPSIYYLEYNISKHINIILNYNDIINNNNINRIINNDTINV